MEADVRYNPQDFHVVYLLFGTDRTVDPSFVSDLINEALTPYYAFPFMPVVQIDAPSWRRVRVEGSESEEYTYVATEGPLARPLPVTNPETGERLGEHPLTFGSDGPVQEATGTVEPPPRFVVGARVLGQLRQPIRSDAVRAEATNALRAKIREVRRSVGLVGSPKAALVMFYEQDRRSAYAKMLDSLQFPSTPRLPGEGVRYASPALFLMFAGAAVGVVAIAAASRRS